MTGPETGGGFTPPEHLAEVMEINALSRQLAEGGLTMTSQTYWEDFFDMHFWAFTYSGLANNSLLDSEEAQDASHSVLIPVNDGDRELKVTTDGQIKIDHHKRGSSEEDISNEVYSDLIGLNLSSDRHAQRYLAMLELLAAAGVGQDESYSYQGRIFGQFEELLVAALNYQEPADNPDDADPVKPETVDSIKQAIETIVSNGPKRAMTSKSLELADDEDENGQELTGRKINLTIYKDQTSHSSGEFIEIEYTFHADDEGKFHEHNLTINDDGSYTYMDLAYQSMSTSYGEPSELDSVGKEELAQTFRSGFEQRRAQVEEQRRMAEEGHRPTKEQLDEILEVLEEAEA